MSTQNETASRYTTSFGFSLAIVSILNALLVIAKEKSPALQAGMKRLTGHHWITHSVVIIALFFIFGFTSANFFRSASPTNRLIKVIVASVLTASVLIAGFYLIAD